MRRLWWGAGSMCALLALGVVGWLVLVFLDKGYPFDDARACEGSDVPLQQDLDVIGLPLPAGAKDVHYVTHSPAAAGDVTRTTDAAGDLWLAVAFRSTAQTMTAYLKENKIVTEGLHDLDDGRFPVGDAGDTSGLGLCGNAAPVMAPAVLVTQEREGLRGQETVGIALQTSQDDRGSIRPDTNVLITVTADPQQ